MKVFYSKFLPPKGFSAINIFGFIIIRAEYRDSLDKHPLTKDRLINHERIHTRQMQEMLFIFFYLWYGVEWLIRWIGCGFQSKVAYKNISFEREAYQNENNMDYLKNRRLFSWLR